MRCYDDEDIETGCLFVQFYIALVVIRLNLFIASVVIRLNHTSAP